MFEAITPIPFDRFVQHVLSLYSPPLRARSTWLKMRQTLAITSELIGAGTTADLTTELIARFITSRPAHVRAVTTRSLLSSLRAACSIAQAERWLALSPFLIRKNWLRPEHPTEKKHHSQADIARVLALAARDVARRRGWARWRAQRLEALASTVAYTGMRRNEALYLRREDVDFERGVIFIVERKRLKTYDSAQPVPMPDALAAVLQEWLSVLAAGAPPVTGHAPNCKPWLATTDRPVDLGWIFPNVWRTGPWTGGSPGYRPLDRLKALGTRAGVEGFNFQSCRHSFASACEAWGLGPAAIQRLLRHRSAATQWHYRHADLAGLRGMAKGIRFAPDNAAQARGAERPPSAAPAPDAFAANVIDTRSI